MDNGASSYRRFLDGDENAAGEIMQELFFSLVFFVDRYVRDVHTAEDIAMDVMSDLFVHRHRYNFKTSLKTYLFMRGKSRAIDFLRHRKAIEMTELTEAEAAEDGDIESKVIEDERKRALSAALGRLPEDMRAAVHLVFFEEMTYDEAARVMGKNRKQIDNLLYRAKKELRIMLGKEVSGDEEY
ncbi:MAG: RNA polymerase sigma factor [Clostridia bacterium]|nr:RNA polymerase sigma factor [Clostridia bacterium]